MKILITGATGYIGSKLVQFLSEETNHEIIVHCRNLPDYFESWRNKFQIVEADIRDKSRFTKELDSGISSVIHLAAFNNIDTQHSPKNALNVTGYGTRTILEIADQLNFQNVIYFSTLQVYGKNLMGTYSISSPLKCQDDYAVTHALGEKYCEMFALSHGLTTNVIRLSNGFGAPIHPQIDRWSIVPACFCKSAAEEQEIVVRSSGRQQRDFVSLDYVCKATKQLLETPGSGFNIFNITSETNMSIWNVAQLTQQIAMDILKVQVELSRNGRKPNNSNNFTVRNNLMKTPMKNELCKKFEYEIKLMVEMLL